MREVTIRSLSNELAENRKMLAAQMDAAKVREAALAESRGERQEWIDSAQACVTLLTCPYYLGTGICASGCRDEPACQTNDTLGEAVALLERIADADLEAPRDSM